MYRINKYIGCCSIVGGIVIILIFMPSWFWFVMCGLFFITIGLLLMFYSCYK